MSSSDLNFVQVGEHEKNLAMTLSLTEQTARKRGHFVIIGDFNTPVQELQAVARQHSLPASIIGFGETYHASDCDSEIDFAIVSASLMQAGVRATKHSNSDTNIAGHDSIEISFRVQEGDQLEYIPMMEHKFKPLHGGVVGPQFIDPEQSRGILVEAVELITNLGIGDQTLIAEFASDRYARESCEALYERWKKLAIAEIAARTGQNFSAKEWPGQPNEPELVSRHDQARKRKGAIAETLGGNLLAVKRQLQELRAHIKHQKGWRGQRSIKLNCAKAIGKAKSALASGEAKAEQKRVLTMCENATETAIHL